MPSEPFLVRLERSVRTLLPAVDAALCVGFSGGPDSCALLHGLALLNAERGGKLRLFAAHLNHKLRPDADADEAFCRAAAGRLSIPIAVERADIAALAGARRRSIERTARDARYGFLETAARDFGCIAVAVAHHADDNAETLLHRIGRGTGLRGLAGIPARRAIVDGSAIQLVRPLLPFRRTELAAFLSERRIEFLIDPSNELPLYTRNRIRMEALPALTAAIGRDPIPALLRLAKQARAVTAFLNAQADSAEWMCLKRAAPDRIEVALDMLGHRPAVVRMELLRRAWAAVAGGEADIETDHLERLMDLADSQAGGRTVELPRGVRARREGGTVIISAGDDADGRPVETNRAD